MATIKDIKAIKLLDSRARQTIAVRIKTEHCEAWASAPAGVSRSKFEVLNYIKGIDFSIRLVNNYSKKLKNLKFESFGDLKKVENLINSKSVGSSATIALEFALLNALAQEKKKPLWNLLNPKAKKFPRILANIIGGAAHAVKGLDIQEILISPTTKNFSDSVFAATDIYYNLKSALSKADKNFFGGKTDEGAWTTSLSDEKALELTDKIVSKYTKCKINIGIDLAASQILRKGKYLWKNFSSKQQGLHANEKKQIEMIENLTDRFNLFYVEDPLHQEAFRGFASLRKRLPSKLICGDDLISTNLSRLKVAIAQNAINAVIIKPNQCGSLIKTKQVFDFANKNNIMPVFSHRSGETTDNVIAHLAFAWQAPFVKFGLASGERIAKLNELIKIEALL